MVIHHIGTKTFLEYLQLCVIALLLTACGSDGNSEGPREPDLSETYDNVEAVERVDASISIESDSYEFLESPEPFIVTASFNEDLSFVSTSSLSTTNATVRSIGLPDNGSYTFSVVPDGSRQDIVIFIPKDAVRTQSGLGNNASTVLTVRGEDTTAPEPMLTHVVLSFNSDHSVNEIELSITFSEDVTSFTAEHIDLESAEITAFTANSGRSYTAVVNFSQQQEEMVASVHSAAFSDDAGNLNLPSNIITLSTMALPPEAVSEVNVSTGLRLLSFSWSLSEYASYYQVMEEFGQEGGFINIGSKIPASGDRTVTISDVALHQQVGKAYVVRACNDAGCVDSDKFFATEQLWDAVGYLKAPRASGRQAFGNAVALSMDGRVMAVAAVNDGLMSDDPHGEQNEELYRSGVVYIYRKINNQWQFASLVQAPNREREDAFGESISLSQDGSVIAVGAHTEDGLRSLPDSNSKQSSGAVYVYRFNGLKWDFEYYLKAPNGNEFDYFGGVVSLDAQGDTLAVSARGKESLRNSSLRIGGVYIFEYSQTGWQQSAFIQPEDQNDLLRFGDSIKLTSSGSALVVGAPGESDLDAGILSIGSAYAYELKDNSWVEIAKFISPVSQKRLIYGAGVSISDSGDTVVVSAPWEDDIQSSSISSGAVYVYRRSEGDNFGLHVKLASDNPVDHIKFGVAIALNGPGDTLVISSSEYSQWARGFYLEESPNDNRPFSWSAHHLYKLQEDSWNKISFVKGGGDKSLAIDSSGQSVIAGSYSDHRLIDGLRAMGDVDFESAEKADLTGAVFIY